MFKFYLRLIIPCVAAVLCVLAIGWLFWQCAFYKASLAALGSVLVCGVCDAVIKDARAGITDDAEKSGGKKPWLSR